MLRLFRRNHLTNALILATVINPASITSGIDIIYGVQVSPYNASNAFDNDNGTSWKPGSTNAVVSWAGLNYNTPVTVNKITIRVGSETLESLRGYIVEYSTDGVNWNAAATITGIMVTRSGNPHSVTFAANTAQYWRARITGSSKLSSITISEIKFEYV